jgi:hypothetical protein
MTFHGCWVDGILDAKTFDSPSKLEGHCLGNLMHIRKLILPICNRLALEVQKPYIEY